MKVSFVVFLILFSLDIVLTFYYLRTLESSPNAATGAIYALNIHGWSSTSMRRGIVCSEPWRWRNSSVLSYSVWPGLLLLGASTRVAR